MRPEVRERSGAQGLLTGIHAAFATALLQAVRETLSSGHTERTLVALAALACLDPPQRLSRSVYELRWLPGVEGDVAELVELNVRLIKHGAREATYDGVVAAIHTLADASGRPRSARPWTPVLFRRAARIERGVTPPRRG